MARLLRASGILGMRIGRFVALVASALAAITGPAMAWMPEPMNDGQPPVYIYVQPPVPPPPPTALFTTQRAGAPPAVRPAPGPAQPAYQPPVQPPVQEPDVRGLPHVYYGG
jgi:hypothetical protein